MKSHGSSKGNGRMAAGLLAATLILAGALAVVPESLATPMENGPQAKIPEVDEDACRANMQAIADAEALYFAEYGYYTDPFGLETSGILPGATSLVCPYDGCAYTVTSSTDSFVITCMCPHSHGRVVDGVCSWEAGPGES
jgi:hypothetical protein